MNSYRRSLATILETAAVPYGLTLATWGSGAATQHFRGMPALWEVFAFLLGGMAGYTLAAMSVVPQLQRTPPASPGARMALTGVLHFFAVGVAVGAASLVAKIPGWPAWPLAGFAGITIYLVLAAAEYRFADRLPPADAIDEER